MNVNKAMIVGRLVDNPEARTTSSGKTVCSLRIATNRVWTDANRQRQEETEYHSVVAWGRTGEIASQYLQKGNMVYIEGRLKTRSWQDSTGVKKYRTEIIAERLQLGPKGFGTTAPNQQEPQKKEPEQKETTPQEEIPIIDEEEEIDVKDIPF